MEEKKCRACADMGWVLRIQGRKPKPAMWFHRGPNQEKPSVCTSCNTVEDAEIV